MTIKQAVNIAIKSGMITFSFDFGDYGGRYCKQTIDTVYDFIQKLEIEDEKVLTLYLGSAYSYTTYGENGRYKTVYDQPRHCHISCQCQRHL